MEGNMRNIAINMAFNLLSEMNQNLQNPAAGVNVCIYNAFGNDAKKRKNRCAEYLGNCGQCIAAILNEDAK